MKTLLEITLLDSGMIEMSSELELLPTEKDKYLKSAIIALNKGFWYTNKWVRLFGLAQQMLDIEVASSLVDPLLLEDDDYYYYYDKGEDEDHEESYVPWYREEKPAPDPVLEKKKETLRPALLEWREKKAAQMGIHDYEVLKHKVLDGIANSVPATEKELMKVRGFGQLTLDRYGKEILSLVAEIASAVEAELAQPPAEPEPF